MENIFKAKFSKVSLILTILFNIVLIEELFRVALNADALGAYKYIIIFIIIFFLTLPHLIHPASYTTSSIGITINKKIFPIFIPLADILEIKEINYSSLFINIRLLGSGGVWGYFGVFYSTVYGKLNMQASNMQNLILISTANNKYIISPDRPSEFISTISKLNRNDN